MPWQKKALFLWSEGGSRGRICPRWRTPRYLALTAMIVMALAMITASAARADVTRSDGLVIRPVVPAHGQPSPYFVEGRKYTVVVFLEGGQKKYFAGTFMGDAMLHGTRKTPTEGVISTIGKNAVIPKTAGKVYLQFKGAHSTLLYKANTDWLIIEAQ
jgi:hypothetical protein